MSTNKALSKIQFMTSIKLLHVSAPECHPQGVYWDKQIQVQHANPGTDRHHWYSEGNQYLDQGWRILLRAFTQFF